MEEERGRRTRDSSLERCCEKGLNRLNRGKGGEGGLETKGVKVSPPPRRRVCQYNRKESSGKRNQKTHHAHPQMAGPGKIAQSANRLRKIWKELRYSPEERTASRKEKSEGGGGREAKRVVSRGSENKGGTVTGQGRLGFRGWSNAAGQT